MSDNSKKNEIDIEDFVQKSTELDGDDLGSESLEVTFSNGEGGEKVDNGKEKLAGQEQQENAEPTVTSQGTHEPTELVFPGQDNISSESNAETDLLKDIPSLLPVLPVRDVVVFNYMMIPLFVGREASVKAVEAALANSRYMLILTQKDESVENPQGDDLYKTGTVVVVMRMLKMPDGRLKLLVQGLTRAEALSINNDKPYLEAAIKICPEEEFNQPTMELEALMRAARDQSEKILNLRGINNPEIGAVLGGLEHPGRLADIIAANLRIKVSDAQEILECFDPVTRLELVNKHLALEVELASMQVHIQESAREGMDKAQREYYLREQMKAIRKELGDGGGEASELDEIREALEKAGLPEAVDKEAQRQFSRLSSMQVTQRNIQF